MTVISITFPRPGLADRILDEAREPRQSSYTKRGNHISSAPHLTEATWDDLPLSAAHRALVAGSAITPEVAAERGYRTVGKRSDLMRLGFTDRQARTPALLIPIHNVLGVVATYQIRPDDPRIEDGKPRRYETPKGARLAIDVPPRVFDEGWLGDPSVPLFVTEGVRKADAAASVGICCLDLLGVYGFRGTNDAGGKTVLVDWESVALEGRTVYVVYDSDVMTKAGPHGALVRLKGILEHRGALVLPVYLPPGEQGEKVGLDDFLAGHLDAEDHGVEHLLDLARRKVRPAVREREEAVSPHAPRILDEAPETLRRPLALVGGRAYAMTRLTVETIVTQKTDAETGEVEILEKPRADHREVGVVVRADGRLFADGAVPGAKPLADLGLDVTIPNALPRPRRWSGEGVKRYLAGDRPAPADVFRRITGVVDHFIDFDRSLAPQSTMCELVACYDLATYMLDAFHVVGYLCTNGERGAGKTSCLAVVAELGYLGRMILSSSSFPSIRDLADCGATLCFDDAEAVMNAQKTKPELAELFLAGNRKGNTVTFKELVNDKWVPTEVNTFCPRLFSAIRRPEPTLASRSIMVPLVKSLDPRRTKSNVYDYETWPCDRRRLLDDLWAAGLAHLAEMPEYAKRAADRARLGGRELEPWWAILGVALWLDEAHDITGLFDRLEGLSVAYQTERTDLEVVDKTRLAVEVLVEMVAANSGMGSGAFVFETGDLSKRTNARAAEMDLVPEGGVFITPKSLGRLLERIRLTKAPKKANKNRWQLTRQELDGLVARYAPGTGGGEKTLARVVETPPQGNGALGALGEGGAGSPGTSPFLATPFQETPPGRLGDLADRPPAGGDANAKSPGHADETAHGNGVCRTHAERVDHATPAPFVPSAPSAPSAVGTPHGTRARDASETCSVAGCGAEVSRFDPAGVSFCEAHSRHLPPPYYLTVAGGRRPHGSGHPGRGHHGCGPRRRRPSRFPHGRGDAPHVGRRSAFRPRPGGRYVVSAASRPHGDGRPGNCSGRVSRRLAPTTAPKVVGHCPARPVSDAGDGALPTSAAKPTRRKLPPRLPSYSPGFLTAPAVAAVERLEEAARKHLDAIEDLRREVHAVHERFKNTINLSRYAPRVWAQTRRSR